LVPPAGRTQGGGSYQALINQALRESVLSQREPLEQILRKVLREELQNYRASGE
jgi:hypothetical protein